MNKARSITNNFIIIAMAIVIALSLTFSAFFAFSEDVSALANTGSAVKVGNGVEIYQRQLKEHNITQSMSRKGNCLDNSIMENFFGRLKVEMFYGEKFQTVDEFVHCLEEYIRYWNNDRISLTLKGMSPVQYRTHTQIN